MKRVRNEHSRAPLSSRWQQLRPPADHPGASHDQQEVSARLPEGQPGQQRHDMRRLGRGRDGAVRGESVLLIE